MISADDDSHCPPGVPVTSAGDDSHCPPGVPVTSVVMTHIVLQVCL